MTLGNAATAKVRADANFALPNARCTGRGQPAIRRSHLFSDRATRTSDGGSYASASPCLGRSFGDGPSARGRHSVQDPIGKYRMLSGDRRSADRHRMRDLRALGSASHAAADRMQRRLGLPVLHARTRRREGQMRSARVAEYGAVDVARYGDTGNFDGIVCRSLNSGLECHNADGHGFSLSRGRQSVF
jgi:hypothetical protein